ncbi:hypothetical protein BHE74_00012582 [Ensete ventricosum]|nr:hypothetical protein GW17_00054695 [Ensete ventricosum]RWW79152.1 hypothetical protein BHE74_00012582 [Ensete ventricosum]
MHEYIMRPFLCPCFTSRPILCSSYTSWPFQCLSYALTVNPMPELCYLDNPMPELHLVANPMPELRLTTSPMLQLCRPDNHMSKLRLAASSPVVDRYLSIWGIQPSFRDKPAFIWTQDAPSGLTWTSITYSELDNAAEAMASQLLCTLNRGDSLLLLCSPGLRLVKLLFSCQRAGIVAVPVIPPDPFAFSPACRGPAHHHLLRAVSQVKPTAAVADRRYIAAVTGSVSSSDDRLAHLLQKLRWLSVEHLDDECPRAATSSLSPSLYLGCGPGDTYLVQYTSGTTGIPKPVLVSAGAAAHNVRAARKAYDLQPSSVVVSWLPQYHDCGLMFLLLTVVAGATCVLASPTAFLHRPRLWLELLTEFHATCTPVPAFALPLAVRRGGINHGKLPLKLGSLRNLILINEPIYKSYVDEFIKEFAAAGIDPSSVAPSYGLAENCTFVSTAWPSDEGCRTRYPNMPCYNRLLPSARLGSLSSSASEGAEIDIVVVDEETCEPVDDGVEGEIWVASASNASGYLGHPSLTREVFHDRLRGGTGSCFVRTGDRGVIRGEERYLYVTGRDSDVIRTHDDTEQYVHAHYIETAAYSSSSKQLRGGCVVAFDEEQLVVMAELQKKKEEEGGVDVYRDICENIREGVRKEEGGRVGWVALVDRGSIPKTTSGKPMRWLAKQKLLEGSLRPVFEARFVAGRHEAAARDRGDGGVGKGNVASLMSYRRGIRRLFLLSFL